MIPIVDVQGSHHQIGAAIGREMRDRVEGMVINYQRLFTELPDFRLTWAQALLQAHKYLPFIEEFLPQVLEELHGIAEGSGVGFGDLLVCNCFEELTDDMLFERCTTVAFAPEHTAEGRVLIGHNEDWLPVDRDLQYIVRAQPDDEPPFIAATYGGLLCNIRFNANGIAQCINSVYPTDARLGLPRLFIGRHVLAATRLGIAIGRALHPRRAAGYNHVLADEHGELYNLETTARRFDLLYAREGYLTHANHYTSDRLRDLEKSPESLAGSHVRDNRAFHLSRQAIQHGAIRLEDMQRILADHVNRPYSICSHAEDVPPGDQNGTIRSYTIDLAARTLWCCHGNPCQGEYVPITL